MAIELTGELGLKPGLTVPLMDASLVKGGFMTVADITARDAIPAARRKEKMEVKVLSDGKKYELSGGIANANWVEVATGLDELQDARISEDSTTYANTGNSIRSQIRYVSNRISDMGIVAIKNCVVESHEGAYWSNTGVLTADANYSAVTVEVEPGKNYSFPSNTYANDNFCLIEDGAGTIIDKFTVSYLTAFGAGYYATMPPKAKYLKLTKYSTTFATTAIVLEGIKNIKNYSVVDYPIGGNPIALKNSSDILLKDGTNVATRFNEIKSCIGSPIIQYIDINNFQTGKYYNTTTNLLTNAGYKCIYVANMPAGTYYINSMSTPFTWFENIATGVTYKASTGMGFSDSDKTITVDFDFNLYLSCVISVSSKVMVSNAPLPSTYKYGMYDTLRSTAKTGRIYHVGSTREYTKLTDAIIDATNYFDSIVYVDAETFDLVAEYTQSYLDNYNTENNFGIELKNRVHVICASGCKIIFNYQGANTYVHTYFAPFNAGAYGFILENAWIESTNCRYSVHDDRNTNTDVYHNVYRRCTMIHDSSNCSWGAHQAIGGGFGRHGDVLIEDGYYVSTGYEDTISYHNTVTTQADTQSKCVIKNAYLSGTTLCANYGTTTKKSQMFVSNCSLGHTPKIEIALIEGRADNMELFEWGNTIRS